MTAEDRENPHHVRTIAPLPAGLRMTPEWHRARAALLRYLNDPDSRYWARQHLNLAKLIEHRRQRQQ
jgi:hypothetical protein